MLKSLENVLRKESLLLRQFNVYPTLELNSALEALLEQNDVLHKLDNFFHKMEFQKMQWNMVMEYSYVRSMWEVPFHTVVVKIFRFFSPLPPLDEYVWKGGLTGAFE